MPALGGRPERISPRGSAEGVSSPQWSADGTELAHMRREAEGNVIEIVSLATRQTRRVTVPGEQGNRFDLSWSRDGRYFAYVRAANRGQEVNRLWVLRVADGEAFAVTDGTTGDWSPMWSADGRTLFFLSNRGGSVDLWQQRITEQGSPDGEASPLTVGVGMRAAALSADGRTLAYARGRADRQRLASADPRRPRGRLGRCRPVDIRRSTRRRARPPPRWSTHHQFGPRWEP